MRSTRKIPGLRRRGKIWYISKVVRLPGGGKTTLAESTGSADLVIAEAYLSKRVRDIIESHVHGIVPDIFFADAAARYLDEYSHLKSIDRAGYALKRLVPEIGNLVLRDICDETLDGYKTKRRDEGVAAATINKELSFVRRILTLASRKWRINGRPLLSTPPLISDVTGEERKAHILTRAEEARLLVELPEHLQDAVVFALNTGLRASEQASLRWTDEQHVTGLDRTVFVIPEGKTKNSCRVVPLNSEAESIVREQRGNDGEYVFTFNGKRVTRFNNHAFRKARVRAGLKDLTWHSLRHTYATRLRAVQVPLDDRAALLGHSVSGGEMTTRYSAPEIGALIAHVEKLVESRPDVTLQSSTKTGEST